MEQTRFLNVDLDLSASFDLAPLVAALEKKAYALHVGRTKRTYQAHLELERRPENADATVRAFCKMIARLPPDARAMWDATKVRDFNVGVQAEKKPHCEVFTFSASTVKAVADLGARIVFTVYSVPAGPAPATRPAAPDPST